MKKTIVVVAAILVLGVMISPALAKRGTPKPVTSIIKDGIEYSAPLDPNRIGFVIATYQKIKESFGVDKYIP